MTSTTDTLKNIDRLIAEAIANMTPDELETCDIDALTDRIVDEAMAA